MRKLIASLLFILMVSAVFAQQIEQDVVYLKNGSIIHGVITEKIPNQSIRIETADKNVFVYQLDEVEKITKEVITKNSKTAKEKRKGYIGISLGASIPLGDFADKYNGGAKTGVELSLVDFGYLFSDNLGIAVRWFGGANPLDSNYDIDPWSYGGILVGPLVSYPISEKVDWDVRPMIGYAVTTMPEANYYNFDPAMSFAFNFGTQFRFHVGEKISLLVHADYFSTKAKFESYDYELKQNIATFSLGFGVAYRLK